MNIADQISRDTEQYDPTILRMSDGDCLFRWRRKRASISRIADATGLEPELFWQSVNHVCLHLPKEIAEAEA